MAKCTEIAIVGEFYYKTVIRYTDINNDNLLKEYELVPPIFKYPITFAVKK